MPIVTVDGEQLRDGESPSRKNNRSVDSPVQRLTNVLLVLQRGRKANSTASTAANDPAAAFESQGLDLTARLIKGLLLLLLPHGRGDDPVLLVRRVVALHWDDIEVLGQDRGSDARTPAPSVGYLGQRDASPAGEAQRQRWNGDPGWGLRRGRRRRGGRRREGEEE